MGLAVAPVVQLTSSLTEQVVVETAGSENINSSAFDPSSELLYRTLYSLKKLYEELFTKLSSQFT